MMRSSSLGFEEIDPILTVQLQAIVKNHALISKAICP